MPYLKHRTTGEVFPMNEHLLKRGDLVEVAEIDSPLPADEFDEVALTPAPEPKAEAKRAPKAKKAAKPAPAPEAPAADPVVSADLLDDAGLDV